MGRNLKNKTLNYYNHYHGEEPANKNIKVGLERQYVVIMVGDPGLNPSEGRIIYFLFLSWGWQTKCNPY